MVRIEELQPGMSLVGLEAASVATIAAVVPISDDSVQVIYKTGDGSLKDRLIARRVTREIVWVKGKSSQMTHWTLAHLMAVVRV